MSLSCGYTLKVQDSSAAMVTVVLQGTPLLTLGSSASGIAAYRRQFGTDEIHDTCNGLALTPLLNGRALRLPGSFVWTLAAATDDITLSSGEILVTPATLLDDQDLYLSTPYGARA